MLRPESSAPIAPSPLRPACRVAFDAVATTIDASVCQPALAVALPVLAGTAEEELLATDVPASRRHGCVVFDTEHATAGFTVAPVGVDLETAARDLYRQLFAATRGRRLYRIWNYVPQINAMLDGLENYRRFCRGRSVAFEQQFGMGYQRQLPAASAVGALEGPLAVAFLAGDAAPHHFENPWQVPAFEYPAAYGPRPPSFSRATSIAEGDRCEVFISGTAAIRGHATIAAGDITRQLACTRENLNVIAATAGAGTEFGATDGWQRTVKVYVRHAADLRVVQSDLERHLLRPDDTVTYLLADLCRSDLLVEVEAVLTL